MTAYEEDTAFMVDLMLGYEIGAGFRKDMNYFQYETLFEDARQMAGVVDRLRAQILSITKGLRSWQRRHDDMERPLERRYSAYEGMLAHHDLRQHWILYRRAQREYARLRLSCHDRMRRIETKTANRAANASRRRAAA